MDRCVASTTPAHRTQTGPRRNLPPHQRLSTQTARPVCVGSPTGPTRANADRTQTESRINSRASKAYPHTRPSPSAWGLQPSRRVPTQTGRRRNQETTDADSAAHAAASKTYPRRQPEPSAWDLQPARHELTQTGHRRNQELICAHQRLTPRTPEPVCVGTATVPARANADRTQTKS